MSKKIFLILKVELVVRFDLYDIVNGTTQFIRNIRYFYFLFKMPKLTKLSSEYVMCTTQIKESYK